MVSRRSCGVTGRFCYPYGCLGRQRLTQETTAPILVVDMCYVMFYLGLVLVGFVCFGAFFGMYNFDVKVFDVWRFDSRSRSHLARLYIPTDRIFLE